MTHAHNVSNSMYNLKLLQILIVYNYNNFTFDKIIKKIDRGTISIKIEYLLLFTSTSTLIFDI